MVQALLARVDNKSSLNLTHKFLRTVTLSEMTYNGSGSSKKVAWFEVHRIFFLIDVVMKLLQGMPLFKDLQSMAYLLQFLPTQQSGSIIIPASQLRKQAQRG